jgi:hypothetical protein
MQAYVHDCDLCSKTSCHLSGLRPYNPASDHKNLAWCHTWHATQKYTSSLLWFLKEFRAFLDRHPTCDF